MEYYIHKVNYYETDKMGVTHHSNYVRWMEEARIDMMDKMGFSYKKLEDFGIASPVLEYECKIKKSTYFSEEVKIYTKCKEYDGVKLTIEYTMSVNDKTVAYGMTKHCFINSSGRPIRLNRVQIEFDQKIRENIN